MKITRTLSALLVALVLLLVVGGLAQAESGTTTRHVQSENNQQIQKQTVSTNLTQSVSAMMPAVSVPPAGYPAPCNLPPEKIKETFCNGYAEHPALFRLTKPDRETNLNYKSIAIKNFNLKPKIIGRN